MTISTTIIKSSYSGNGSTSAFTYNFKITDQDDIEVIIRSANGTETVKTLTTHYTVSGVGGNSGTVTFTAGNIPITGETVVLRRSTPQTQTMDLIDNDPMSAETIETAHDKSTSISQELQEQVDRSIKLSRTNTMTSTEFTVDATNRANKVLSFDANGELSVAQELGTFKGSDATTTTAAYVIRDIVKSSTAGQLNNIYICIQDSPAGTLLTNTSYWTLIVDAVAAGTSATAAATSATAAASSATAAASSASAAATSETNTDTSETNAATSETNAATSATNAATSETNASTSETNAASSATAAASSATSASGSASTATTQASNASTSATNAANSAAAAATSESNASTSESNASTSETNAASSASTASTQASNAATSATNAASSATAASNAQTSVENIFDNFDDRFLGTKTSDPTVDNDGNALSVGAVYYNSTANSVRFYNGSSWDAPATSAATSATNAANSASAASTSETNAASSASTASTQATNAATSATNAATSETNAASSATSAASSASTATTKASEASTSASNASTSETNAATSATSASGSATTATTQATNASNSASAASTSASNASTSETNAATSASTASTQATNAASSATAAASSATSAANSLDTFDDRFLGAKSSDPTLDNDGDALIDGALYFDSTNNVLKVYDLGNTQWLRTTPTSSDQTNINTVAGISSDVTDVANIAANVTTTANNVSGINSFAERYRVGSSDPTTSLDAGDLAFNTTGSVFKYYDGSAWQQITAGGITDLLQDSTPELGGDLGLNSNDITGTGNINITGNISLTGTVDGRDIATDGTKLDGIATNANNYVLPTNLAGDDIDIDTGALTGATVISDLDLNVTTDTSGRVTDANATVATRNLTLANLGYTGATDATNNTGTVTSVGISPGTGLDAGSAITSSGNISVTLDLSELTDMTADVVGSTDELILLDSGAERRKAINEIKLSQFNNDSGFTSNTGDITGVTAGNGLTGGGSSGSVTLNVGAGTGIDVAADTVSVDVSDFMSNGSNNRVLTATGTDAMNAEANMTFDGSTLNVTGSITTSGNVTSDHVLPNANDTYDLGASGNVWRNIYTGDLHLSNEAKEQGNSVDGTKGNWTIQEGAEDLYILNNKTNKKFKFKLEEIK